MSAHTPGPWAAAVDLVNGVEWNIDANGWHVAVCMDAPGDGTAERNARLIAAAPELFDAIKEYLAVRAEMGIGDHPAVKKMRAAIAKAEGR